LAKVRALNLPPSKEQLVLGDNFLRLIAHVQVEPRETVIASIHPPLLQAEGFGDPWL
jgi:hypothetical protein